MGEGTTAPYMVSTPVGNSTVDIKITILFFFENGQREILLEYFQTL